MKSAIIIAAMLLGVTGNIKAQEAPKQQSYIYVYRGGQWASSLTNYTIFYDGQKICKISNNKYFKIPAQPGRHILEARKAGVGMFKKETSIEIEVVLGSDNYIDCDIKRSITRQRLEMNEVVAKNGKKAIADMKEDNCQDDVEAKKE